MNFREGREDLKTFLGRDENSRTRESIINLRLFYELKLAAALSNYDLSLYTPDVDRDGFDIILDDLDTVRKIQLKTVLNGAKTTSWGIHRSILRADHLYCEQLGYPCTHGGVGVQGGVILLELIPKMESLQIDYYYTDIFVITALELGIVKRTKKIKESVFTNFRINLYSKNSTDKIAVPKSLFVKVKGPEHLLGIMALHNGIEYAWWNHLLAIAKDQFYQKADESKLVAPLNNLRAIVADSLLKLTDDLNK